MQKDEVSFKTRTVYREALNISGKKYCRNFRRAEAKNTPGGQQPKILVEANSLLVAQARGALLPAQARRALLPAQARRVLLPGQARRALLLGQPGRALLLGLARRALLPGQARRALLLGQARRAFTFMDDFFR